MSGTLLLLLQGHRAKQARKEGGVPLLRNMPMAASLMARMPIFLRRKALLLPRRTAEAWEMAMLTPMIHTNQGKTRSATVKLYKSVYAGRREFTAKALLVYVMTYPFHQLWFSHQ